MALDAQYSQNRAGKGDQGTPSLRALGPASQGDPHPAPPWMAIWRSLPSLPESAHSLPASAQENATRMRMWTQRASVARCLQPPWALPEEGKTWQDTKRNPGPTGQPHPGLWGRARRGPRPFGSARGFQAKQHTHGQVHTLLAPPQLGLHLRGEEGATEAASQPQTPVGALGQEIPGVPQSPSSPGSH